MITQKPKLLIVAPNSYPPINPEANVNAKVIKLLAEAGYSIDLICRPPRRQIYSDDQNRDFFFDKVNSIQIVSVNPAFDLKTIIRHAGTLFKTGFVYKGADWAWIAACVCDKLIEKNKYDFIYTYDSPSEIVGLYVAKKYGIRWIATWNDPYIWNKYPHPYGQGYDYDPGFLHNRLIRQIGKYTYRNAFPSSRLRDYMLKYMTGMRKDSCIILPHLVSDELTIPNGKQPGDTLKIIHSGALGKERDPKTLFEGLRIFIDKHPDAKIELSLLGIFERAKEDYISTLIEKYDIGNYLKLLKPVSYSESLKIVKDYDVCLVVEADLEEGIFLPSKISDYLQNSKPIFAISPRVGLLNDEYKNGIIDYFSDVKSAQSVAGTLEIIYGDFKNGTLGSAQKDDSKYRNRYVLSLHQKYLQK